MSETDNKASTPMTHEEFSAGLSKAITLVGDRLWKEGEAARQRALAHLQEKARQAQQQTEPEPQVSPLLDPATADKVRRFKKRLAQSQAIGAWPATPDTK